jgi:hypothetical protein
MRVTSAGNVGIGTTGPLGKLQIVTSSDITPGTVTTWDSRHFVVGQSASTGGVAISYNNTSGYGIINALSPGVAWRNLILQSGGGNVGIGTTSPTAKLDIAGSIKVNGGTTFTKIQAGTTTVGTGTGGTKVVNITFPTTFSGTPKVTVTLKCENYNDVFVVCTKNVAAGSFDINVTELIL